MFPGDLKFPLLPSPFFLGEALLKILKSFSNKVGSLVGDFYGDIPGNLL
jgi:hypothetical protein